jgi:hypothetical protein
MESTVVFNHIPKTGGTTLRIVFNRMYGQENIFWIESTSVAKSLESFMKLNNRDRGRYKVVTGHGAALLRKVVHDPIFITILREPVSLFVSQYRYLKESPNSIFREKVSRLGSMEAYIDFAVEHGQDNLLTRYVSGEIGWLADPDLQIPGFDKEGDRMLNMAKQRLHDYQAVLSLEQFDLGVFMLKQMLGWERIPFYRFYNKTKGAKTKVSKKLASRLDELLRFDLELYRYFRDQKIDIALKAKRKGLYYHYFRGRQSLLGKMG